MAHAGSLWNILSALGCIGYQLTIVFFLKLVLFQEDMNDFVNHLADFVGLYFEADETSQRHPRRPSQSLNSLSMFRAAEDAWTLGKPKWQWPSPDGQAHLGRSVTKSVPFSTDGSATRTFNVVPAQALMDVFLSTEADVPKRIFGPRLMNQFRAMKEILLAGDTNRLVAELTFVRINDLAAPPEPVHPLMYIEPFVAILIVLNGILIGFQTDPAYQDWPGWAYVDLAFQSFLLLEILFRMHFLRCRKYWWGPESWWNWFDLFLFGSGLADVILQFAGDQQSDIAATSLLRFCRLIRLVRIVKASVLQKYVGVGYGSCAKIVCGQSTRQQGVSHKVYARSSLDGKGPDCRREDPGFGFCALVRGVVRHLGLRSDDDREQRRSREDWARRLLLQHPCLYVHSLQVLYRGMHNERRRTHPFAVGRCVWLAFHSLLRSQLHAGDNGHLQSDIGRIRRHNDESSEGE